MPRKRNNPVNLTADDRRELRSLIKCGSAPARQLTHARILLKADEGGEGGEDAPSESSWPETRESPMPWRSAARRSYGCARGSWRRAWRPLLSIAGPKTPSPKSSMVPRRHI